MTEKRQKQRPKVRPATRWLFGRILEMHARNGEGSCYPGTERIAILMGCSRATVVNLIAAIRADDNETIRVRYQAREPGSVRRLPNVYTWHQVNRPGWYVDGLRRLLALYQTMPESIGSTPRAILAALALGRGFQTQGWIGHTLGLDRRNVRAAMRALADAGLLRVTHRVWGAGTGKGGQCAANTYEIHFVDGWRDASPQDRNPEDESDQDLAKPQDGHHADACSTTACDQRMKTTPSMGRKRDRPGDESDQDLAAEISLYELAGLPADKSARLTITTKRSRIIESIRAVLRQTGQSGLDTEKVAGRLYGIAANRHDGVLEAVLPSIVLAYIEAERKGYAVSVDAIVENLVPGDVNNEAPVWGTLGRLLDEGHRDAPVLLSQLCAACYGNTPADKSRRRDIATRIMAAAA